MKLDRLKRAVVRARVRAGYTQLDLATVSGVSLSRVQRIEQLRDRHWPSVGTLCAIAEGLGIKTSELLELAEGK